MPTLWKWVGTQNKKGEERDDYVGSEIHLPCEISSIIFHQEVKPGKPRELNDGDQKSCKLQDSTEWTF
jgi:hypothetical protein